MPQTNTTKTQTAQTAPYFTQRLKHAIKHSPLFPLIRPALILINPLRDKIEYLRTKNLSDEAYFLRRHQRLFGYTPDFRNPKTFNEKIIHRMLFDRNPIYTALADKLKARIYIASKLQNFDDSTNNSNLPNKQTMLNQDSPLFAPIDSIHDLLFATNSSPFLPKLYGIWKSVDDIDFDSLPESFVLKTNHDGGGVVLVPDKQEFLTNKKQFKRAVKRLCEHLGRNHYSLFREWHYKDIEPRVFAEELLKVADSGGMEIEGEYKAPEDYKAHVFGEGEETYMQVDTDRFTNHTRTMFDNKWERQPFELCYPAPESTPPKPTNADTMFAIAKEIGKDFDAIRVDMYNTDNANIGGGGKIIIGELTFTHGGGIEKFTPSEWDEKFAKAWRVRKTN
ncbi:ATP-grasp fold amidoligase family protein [Helicobacter sp. CLO-3]|uniref:ATP-grasp fold amidoligase family protein n=1 Tax=Helicobacter sp. CLO-3 TaxID=211 RepID=UPI0009ED3ADF|nr:ATP-grasp fold amidoligase family protein [Helicobacter sp. CLO-3]